MGGRFSYILEKAGRETKPVIFCGDEDTAHTEIDAKNQRRINGKNAGFTDEERQKIQSF